MPTSSVRRRGGLQTTLAFVLLASTLLLSPVLAEEAAILSSTTVPASASASTDEGFLWSERPYSTPVDAYASGGDAARTGTAGLRRSYSRFACYDFDSQGRPAAIAFKGLFQKDKYNDGSYKVYLKASSQAEAFGDVFTFNDYAPPQGGVYEIESRVRWTFNSEASGSEYLKAGIGAAALGAALGVTVESSGNSGATSSLEVNPSSCCGNRYQLDASAASSPFILRGWKL